MQIVCESFDERSVDVVVVGGGTAGVFAAISAARLGASVLLVEKNAMLGGTVTAGGVNFPGLFFAWGKQIISGPCWEAIERTVRLGGATLPEISYRPERHWHEQILVNRFVYTAVLCEMCAEAGVEVLCNAMLTSVTECEDSVSLAVTCKEGVLSVFAKTAIDATGDANLAQMAGLETVKSPVQQPATLQNHLAGYTLTEEIEKRIEERFDRQSFPDYVSARKLIGFLRKRKIDLHVPCRDAETSVGRTALDFRALADVMGIYRFYRSVEGLESLELDWIAAESGVRETVRIVGRHAVTAEEYINGTSYPDSVCYAFYPIDLHVMDGIKQTYHADGVVAKLPFGALVPQRSGRILVAGRCLSSDTDANSALRVEAVCMATGQVVGCAAALAAGRNEKAAFVPHGVLCDALRSIGAIVPSES